MLWVRGAIFTLLVPFVIAGWAPAQFTRGMPPAGGLWQAGWILLAAGALLYLWCLLLFLASGGTPAIFFTRPLRFLLGTEPGGVVREGPYRFSRNPMYVGVVSAILGQAVVYRSAAVLAYGAAVALCFHLVVVLYEEPHLRAVRGAEYDSYRKRVRRWI